MENPIPEEGKEGDPIKNRIQRVQEKLRQNEAEDRRSQSAAGVVKAGEGITAAAEFDAKLETMTRYIEERGEDPDLVKEVAQVLDGIDEARGGESKSIVDYEMFYRARLAQIDSIIARIEKKELK